MATILAISSQVVRGAVGNSAGVFALQRLGHTVWQIPTVLLSNHPGHGAFRGNVMDAQLISELWEGIKRHGWHLDIDAVMSGYVPTPETAKVIANIVHELKAERGDPVFLCDPAIGDEPKGLYVDVAAAVAVRDDLLPLATYATPNRFELSWLSGVENIVTAIDACGASRKLATNTVVTTSVPGGMQNSLANVLNSDKECLACSTLRCGDAPKGTGDLFAALFLGHCMNASSPSEALGRATAGVAHVVEASGGKDVLQIVATQSVWAGVKPAAVEGVAT